ncbi:MAG: electron transfer flavoprotein subunit alpha/FixB family protein [Euryarchaeota archaeon]|nr:electron transfer flavoprotein subunit alpha/FixB family protein [Euryarchaeota archaeon]
MVSAKEGEWKGIWVFMERADQGLARVGLELLGRGRALADEVHEVLTAVILGDAVEAQASLAATHGADRVIVVEHPLLRNYSTESHAKVMTELVSARRPNIVLFGATPDGRDLAGRLAVRLRTGLTANAVRLEIDREKRILLAGVPGFGGSVVAMIKCETGRPQLSTVRAGVFAPCAADAERRFEVERVRVDLTEADVPVRLLGRESLAAEDVAAAERVVVAGLGVAGDLRPVERIALAMGASLAVTRPLVDAGGFGRDRQVGSTGIALRGKLAIVAGASGASHFVSGLRDVGLVIAINKDASAPIFEHADLCLVGDAAMILSLATDELERVEKVSV